MLVLAAALALLFQPDPAPPDTVDTAAEGLAVAAEEAAEDIARFRVRPVFSLGSLYSPSKGVGLGGGIAVSHVLAPDDHLQIEARLSQRLQGGHLEYLTAEPGAARLAGVVGAAAWTTTRTSFHGHGPHSAADAELYLDRLAAEAEARLAWAPSGPDGLRLQPTVRGRFDRVRGFEERTEGALAATDRADLTRLNALVGEDRYGVEVALSALRDTRDIPSMPSRGSYVEGEVGRFQALDGTGLGVWRAQATALAFRPAPIRLPVIPERGAIFVRATGVITRQDGDDPLPWVYLPELHRDLTVGYPRNDFVGRDGLAVGVGVRGVIGEAIGAFLVEGVSMVTLGAAYDDVFSEFTPRIRTSASRPAAGEAVPLSPSLGVGLNLRYLERERPIVGALVGLGLTGVTTASLRLVWGLGAYRARIR